MNSGMIDKKLFKIMFKIYKFFLQWENLEVEELKFQIVFFPNSIWLIIRFPQKQTWKEFSRQ